MKVTPKSRVNVLVGNKYVRLARKAYSVIRVKSKTHGLIQVDSISYAWVRLCEFDLVAE